MAGIYPSWRYHATQAPCVVHTPSADAALGDGWFDSPASVVQPPATPPPVIEARPTQEEMSADIYAAHWKTVVASLNKATDASIVEFVERVEAKNPSGPRGAILAAVRSRLAVLSGVTEMA